jgi:hypothetical protein
MPNYSDEQQKMFAELKKFPAEDNSPIADLSLLYEKLRSMAVVVNQWNGKYELGDAIVETVMKHMTPETRVQLIWHLLAVEATVDELSFRDKEFALMVAATIGPDWAQWLYRFAVVVTKLA